MADQHQPIADSDLIEIVRDLATELHPEAVRGELDLHSHLEKDAGIDSLGRIELLLRIDRQWSVALPEESAVAAERIGDLYEAICAALEARGTAAPQAASAVGRLPPRGERPVGVWTVPENAGTLAEVLDFHARERPEQACVHLLGQEGTSELSYGGLREGAVKLARGLRALRLAPGRSVAIMLPTSPDYIFTFFGVLLAGGVPVPVYPPLRMAQLEDHLLRRIGIFRNARADLLITMQEALRLAPLLMSSAGELRRVLTPDDVRAVDGPPELVRSAPTDTAFMQYTSGSTGRPKGVVLSHANLLANIRAMGRAAGVQSSDVFVSWLPLYHDMGLIGALLSSLYYGLPLYLMSPLYFMARPVRWLRAISDFRGTVSAAPNFAYELCAHRIESEELEGMDLSSWRLAFNGAEPVSARTLEAFTERFRPVGLRSEAVSPVYGLAENCVGLSFPPPGRGARVDCVDRAQLEQRGVAVACEDGPGSSHVVGCGVALPGHAIRVVDEHDDGLPDRSVGRVQFRGPSATNGYFENPEATRALIRPGGWLDTGDLGYLDRGELFLTGRSKEMIIRGGRNIYPYELEEQLTELSGVRSGGVAVFGIPPPDRAEAALGEGLVVVVETRGQNAQHRSALQKAIADRTVELLGFAPSDVVLAPPRSVLRTSSGKIRRSAIRDLYLAGRLGRESSLVLQEWRVRLRGVPALLSRGMRAVSGLFYQSWTALVFALLGPPAFLCVVLFPWRARWFALRGFGRLLLGAVGVRVAVRGREHIVPRRPLVVVANHSSYLDGLLLAMALQTPLLFVAKAEFRGTRLAGLFLRALRVRFVERFRAGESIRDEANLEEATAHTHRPVVFFPEGTFTDHDGLRSFRMGAFVDALHTGAALQPVAIRGSRVALRGDSFRLRPARVEVTILPESRPQGSGWSEALRLRNEARRAILEYCGEPDLSSG